MGDINRRDIRKPFLAKDRQDVQFEIASVFNQGPWFLV